MLQEEGLVIAEKLHVDGFVASDGWLERFKNAHKISTMAVAGEEADFMEHGRDWGLLEGSSRR